METRITFLQPVVNVNLFYNWFLVILLHCNNKLYLYRQIRG